MVRVHRNSSLCQVGEKSSAKVKKRGVELEIGGESKGCEVCRKVNGLENIVWLAETIKVHLKFMAIKWGK